MKTALFTLKNLGRRSLVVIVLLALVEVSLLFGSSINSIFALINEPPAQEVVESGLFDFEVDYLGEVEGRKDEDTGVIGCTTHSGEWLLGSEYDYFIVKMNKGGFNFVNFGPYSGDNPTYWTDLTQTYTCESNPYSVKAIDVSGTSASNYSIKIRPTSNWSWRVWRVKVNDVGFPEINKPNFIKHNDEDYAFPNDGSLTAGCTVSYLMMDDDPAIAGDERQQTWHVQKKNLDNTWSDIQPPILAPDSGMVVGQSFPVAEVGGTPELRLFLEIEDSINMLHLEQCGSTYTYQIEMNGVFIATGQREREGSGESGFKFERDIFVPAGVAPLLISYDPKYLFEFADLLGESLVDWVEVPN